jgi:threonine dehydrogenase-like Zn-dependent dehydrogenase
MEASPGHGQGGLVSAVKEKVIPAERAYVLDQAIRAVRPCGVVSVPGVYGGPLTVNMGSIVQKGLRLCSGQTHVKTATTRFFVASRRNRAVCNRAAADETATLRRRKSGKIKQAYCPHGHTAADMGLLQESRP